jgi:hypothetical protein
MFTDSTRSVRVVASLGALGLVIASAGFGALYAYKVGIQHGIILAGLSVLMAVALEAIKPLALSAGLDALKAGSSKAVPALLLTLGGISVAYSLTAELSLISMSKGDLIAERQAQSTDAGNADRDRKRIEAELAVIGITRPSASVQAELDGILADDRLKGCKEKLDSWRLAATCTDKVSPLRSELYTAEHREALERQLSAGHTLAAKDADPGSTALVTYLSALGFTVPAAVVGQWLILVPVLALEIGSALAYVLVQAVSSSSEPHRVNASHYPVAPGPMVQAHSTASETATTKVKAAIVDHLKAHGGKVQGGERGLAKLIGSSRGTMKRAINGLVLTGIVAAEAGRNGTMLRLLS